MVEDIEELGDRAIALPLPLEHQLRVMPRQDARRAREPHEGHEHRREAIVLRPGELVDGAGRERQRVARAKSYDLICGMRIPPDARSLGKHSFEQPDSLEEFELESFREEEVLYRRICSPALGGHRFSGSLRCRVRATSCMNELREA